MLSVFNGLLFSGRVTLSYLDLQCDIVQFLDKDL